MKVLLAAVGSSITPDGVSRHEVNLARCLLLRPEVEQVDLVVGEWQRNSMCALLGDCDSRLRLLICQTGQSAIARNWWYWSRLPSLATELGSDIVHLAYPVPIRRSAFACPVVVSLHDLYPYDIPENFGYSRAFANRLKLQQCLRAADAVASISRNTLHRLEIYASSEVVAKAVTIYNCVTSGPQTASGSPLPEWANEPFLLCVAQHRRNKNLPLSIEVFQRLLATEGIAANSRMVIVGSKGPETAGLTRLLTRAGLRDRVALISGIGDAELKWLYSHCELLLATSTIEGFGLPIVEAMLNHCRIVCSDIPAFREVGGAYCHFASVVDNPLEAFVNATRIALKSHRFRATHAESFSAESVGTAYVSLYRRLLQVASIRLPNGERERTPAFQRGRT